MRYISNHTCSKRNHGNHLTMPPLLFPTLFQKKGQSQRIEEVDSVTREPLPPQPREFALLATTVTDDEDDDDDNDNDLGLAHLMLLELDADRVDNDLDIRSSSSRSKTYGISIDSEWHNFPDAPTEHRVQPQAPGDGKWGTTSMCVDI